MTNKIISFQNINKSFKNHKVLNDLSFDVCENKVFGLIGLNGIGKTTLIKCLLNIYNDYFGSIVINGIDAKENISRKSLYYLPEKFMPSLSLTGLDFINISCSFHDGKCSKEKVFEYADFLNFDKSVLVNRIGTYSKGMIQKIAIISAFISNAKVLIFDEPMSGLDPYARVLLKKVMKEYMKSGNKVIFFSSHILSDIQELCDEVSLIHNGELKFCGDPNAMIKENLSFEQSFLEYIL